ncbi:MAG: hypothetical protein NTZ26_07685 [Candidatus Aminicenantes bacterium]|nr:hypothetical protein [Candidatus Aminicenantes bacterium]
MKTQLETALPSPTYLEAVKRIGTGLAFVLFPLVFIFAFAIHPGLLAPRLLGPQELIQRAHGDSLLQFGHVLVTLSTGLLVVIALRFKSVLDRHAAGWAGLVGAALAIFGALMLAADKGALCLTMSALDTLPEGVFAQFLPGLLAMFSKAGWLALLWGFVALPVGFAIQAVALLKTRALPRWQGVLFLIGVLLVGTPDGMEAINLSASFLMGIALVPYGIKLIVDRPEQGTRTNGKR